MKAEMQTLDGDEVPGFYEMYLESDIPISTHRKYLEFVTEVDILDIHYARDFSEVWLEYRTDMITTYEQWRSASPGDVAGAWIEVSESDLELGLQERAKGEEMGWQLVNVVQEFECLKPSAGQEVRFLDEGKAEAAVELMKQEWWSEEEASDFIRKSLRIEGVEVFVKRSGVRCTGFLQLSASENMAWIAAIYVRQGYRDQGIVSELVSMSKSWAAENGVEEIRLCSNSEKAEFWDANGFDTADFTSYEFRP